LPTPLAWYLHQWPAWFHTAETATVLLLELVVPLLLFVPQRGARLSAAALLAGLQVLILLTDNYAFFNLLSLTLCVVLLTTRFCAACCPRDCETASPPHPAAAAPATPQSPHHSDRGTVAGSPCRWQCSFCCSVRSSSLA
jgi:hypothetical protein